MHLTRACSSCVYRSSQSGDTQEKGSVQCVELQPGRSDAADAAAEDRTLRCAISCEPPTPMLPPVSSASRTSAAAAAAVAVGSSGKVLPVDDEGAADDEDRDRSPGDDVVQGATACRGSEDHAKRKTRSMAEVAAMTKPWLS